MKTISAPELARPFFEEINYIPPLELFNHFAETEGNLLVHSADNKNQGHGTNQYSYILVNPFDTYCFSTKNSDNLDPLNELHHKFKPFQLQSIEHLPPFQGGLAGYLSYDLVHLYHPVVHSALNDLQLPEIYIGFYDLVCSFDHVHKKAYIIASGFPALTAHERQQRAFERIAWFKNQMTQLKDRPGHLMKSALHIDSNFTKTAYLNAVNRVIDYIRAGDIFEANLSQRFNAKLPTSMDCYQIFRKLCLINPSPFAAYLHAGPFKIISASPERFLKVSRGYVETRPIKGTRARSLDCKQDAINIQELITSEKERAENIMIVDLMRNDLAIVCEDDSIFVPQLCGHEIYPTVHHLVSVITGKLRKHENLFSLLKATFPGGSITGAPKIRAMQIIAELEPHNRGPYCGSMVLIGFDGNMDSSILIRSYVIKDDLITFHAGGAVVIDSCPHQEYQETLNKSLALKQALTP